MVSYQFLIREQMLISTCERATENFPTPKIRQGESGTRTITPAEITIAGTSMLTAPRIMLATVILKILAAGCPQAERRTAPAKDQESEIARPRQSRYSDILAAMSTNDHRHNSSGAVLRTSETIVIITLSMIPHIDLLRHMGCSGSLCKFLKGSSSCQKEN